MSGKGAILLGKFNDYNYKKLADAIVGQAVIDYCCAGGGVRGRRIKKSVKKFIKSGWFTELTEIDPDFLIERMDKYGSKDILINLQIEEA